MRDDDFLAALETGTLPLAQFDHRAHVRAGYLYVTRHGFGGAVERFARTLKSFAARHGKDGLYHETITVAFLALINEHVASSAARDWESFIAGNPELLDRATLRRFYGPEELASPEARRVFLLPRRREQNRIATSRRD
jgi:alkanesulfonate monooxygenase SsuD/methylene tetrahydromethanopterin reductase-like flavin-dependent oxidoreductase (luciferase family)